MTTTVGRLYHRCRRCHRPVAASTAHCAMRGCPWCRTCWKARL